MFYPEDLTLFLLSEPESNSHGSENNSYPSVSVVKNATQMVGDNYFEPMLRNKEPEHFQTSFEKELSLGISALMPRLRDIPLY